MGKMSNCDEAFKDNNSYCLIDKDMVSIPDIKSFSPVFLQGSETYLYPVSAHSCMTSSIPVYCTSCTQSSLILSQNTLRPGLVTSPIPVPHVKVESGVLTHIPTSPSSTETLTLENTGSNSESSKNGEEFFTCRWLQCNERFHGLDDLVNHVNDQHVKLERPDVEFQCKWTGCSRQGRGFNARYKMLIHIRTHTNEKPHCCSVCNKSFSRLENLKIHHRSHTGEKPYNCPYPGCNKAYSNSSDRFKHVRTHQEQKPYICKLPGCNKRYTDPSSLRKHVRTHKHFVPTPNVTTPSVNTKKKSPKSMKGDNCTSTVIADKPILNEVDNKTNESTISKAFDPVLNHSDPTVLMQFPTILMNSSSPFTKSSASEMAEVTSIINVVPLVMTSSPDTSNSSDYQDGPLDLSRSPASPHYSIGTSFSPG